MNAQHCSMILAIILSLMSATSGGCASGELKCACAALGGSWAAQRPAALVTPVCRLSIEDQGDRHSGSHHLQHAATLRHAHCTRCAIAPAAAPFSNTPRRTQPPNRLAATPAPLPRPLVSTARPPGVKRLVDLYLPPSFGCKGSAPPPLWIHLHGLHSKSWYPDGYEGEGPSCAF